MNCNVCARSNWPPCSVDFESGMKSTGTGVSVAEALARRVPTMLTLSTITASGFFSGTATGGDVGAVCAATCREIALAAITASASALNLNRATVSSLFIVFILLLCL